MFISCTFFFFILEIVHPASASASVSVSAFAERSFIFNGFRGKNLSLSGVAEINENGILKLTQSTARQFGRAFFPTAIYTRKSAQTLSSFSTTFVFCISPMDAELGGHGMAFAMAPSLTSGGAFPSQYLGLLNATNENQTYNHLFAVEFDTVQDLEFADIDDNHVGINVNSMISTFAENAGYWGDASAKTEINLKSEENIQAWIDYDGNHQMMNVSLALAGSPRPRMPLISVMLNLSNVFEEQMYVGFTAATGVLSGTHRVLAWSFNNNGPAESLDISALPSIFPPPPLSSTTGFRIGVSFASAMVFFLYRWSEKEVVEGWELEFSLHRYAYKELKEATCNFSEKELLGLGGFGRVYRGVLRKSGLEVAVKRLSRESDQGEKEFIAEIASTGRLRQKNLLQLLGWSRRKGQLFLVYEYMPNGSLDKLLHTRSRKALRWEQRYKILKDIAAGMLYLHEGWEQQVLHRDIKSSNVLLDAEMNAKVGDFGLSRLHEHGQKPHTTRVVGTLGYLAPEFAKTGRADTSTDVYSFGVLLLEVVAGRRPINYQVSVEDFLLVDRVLELHLKGRLLEAVDPRLDGLFNVEDVQKVMELGLLCVHPDPLRRPSMRQVVKVLTFNGYLTIQELNASAHYFRALSTNQPWNSVDSSTSLSAR